MSVAGDITPVLTQLRRNPEERQRMGAAARARAHFSCQQMVNSIAALYGWLIQAKR